ncbi:hypothetical protein H4219_002538 [Mycoemilia scoparia]|uniref:Peroxin-5 n=1 Tax=Mycoemilia scoparia TaxID=417184 RepID=A0A9W8DTW8_9FUNG|nr:hypothetical protein H4219_002538 [Mycoemilia scoparia]
MSGFSELVGAGGADCGPGNPMAGLMKQFDHDRSLEQDRYGSGPAGPSSAKRDFRQTFRNNVPAGPPMGQMTDEFHRQMNAGPHQQGPVGPNAFNFNDFHRELNRTAGPAAPMQRHGADNWANDFAKQASAGPSTSGQHDAFEKVFQQHSMAMPPPHMSQQTLGPMAMRPNNWASEFSNARIPGPIASSVAQVKPQASAHEDTLQRAFNEARFHAQGIPMVNPMISTQVPIQQNDSATDIKTDKDGARDHLAELAGQVLESAKTSANPKFKTSEFFAFMQQLRDGDATIENNQVTTTTANATSTAADKTADPKGKSVEGSGSTWASEFESRVEGLANRAGMSKSDDPTVWTQEFAKGIEKDWAEEFETSLDGPLKDSNVSAAPKDWAEEFTQKEEMIKLDEAFTHASGEAPDWVTQYRKNIEPLLNETDKEWDDIEKAWDNYHPGSTGYLATDPALNVYNFQRENPFEQLSSDELSRTIDQIQRDPTSTSLGDAILALEASVNKNPQDARAWTLLGIKQQENEQEQASIAALRKAISIDPNALDAHIALAVSYTNENYHTDAYGELHEWLSRHPKYKSIVPHNGAERMKSPTNRKEYVQELFLQAARQAPGQEWDPDVQIALGVIFNISEEYDKAVDCFRAALSKRPSDYMVWNKLGATLANARKSPEATSAYFKALELQPSYIRARYNLAIASINMNHHREAAEHLLGALALQKRESQRPAGATAPNGGVGADGASGTGFIPASAMSNNIWVTLRMTMYMLNMPDLANACEAQDLEAFRTKFDF